MRYSFLGCWLVILVQAASASPVGDAVAQATQRHADHRPRLLASDDTFTRINRDARRDPIAAQVRNAMLAEAEAILSQPVVQRVMTGRRLLHVSRAALHRIATLAMAYRLTGQEQFLRRAEREMLAVCEFTDWNPSHFLDVAEMTMGLALGYDWLYAELTPDARERIAQAIVDKGLKASLAGNPGWVRLANNWNQVCHGGLAAGALAVMQREPELAARIIERAVENLPIAMKAGYDPTGTYPEGPGYWAYGTTYNVILIACLQSALGTDFGLTDEPGFDHTADFYNHAIGPSGQPFNYADGRRGRAPCEPAVYWFAAAYDRPLWRERMDQALANEGDDLGRQRFSWLIPLWRDTRLGRSSTVPALDWHGLGEKPVAMYRSSWTDPRALYLGVSAGSPSTSHGHMDIGSFVFEADGVRWAIDLGAQDYESLESRGVDLWNMRQDSQRWDVFRLNNLSHNTLVVNDRHQRVAGVGKLAAFSDDRQSPFCVVDLSNVYEGQAKALVRGFALPSRRKLLVYDKIDSLAEDSTLRWGFVTEADVQVDGSSRAVLQQDQERLVISVLQPADAQLKVFETAAPRRSFDAPNPGTRMVGFTAQAQAGESLELVVLLHPAQEQPLRGAERRFTATPPTDWQSP